MNAPKFRFLFHLGTNSVGARLNLLDILRKNGVHIVMKIRNWTVEHGWRQKFQIRVAETIRCEHNHT